MALVVEDGTGKSDAESYVSVDACGAYATLQGLEFSTLPADDAEAALRRATRWLDARYRTRFPGRRVNGRSQALEWPRTDAWTSECPPELIADDEIPAEIVKACCEAAIRELAEAGSLNPDFQPGSIIKRDKVGDVETEFKETASANPYRPIVGVIDDLLAGLLKPANLYFGRAVRA